MYMLVGMVRTKFVAVLLGPTGIGLRGTYFAITSLVGIFAQFGIGSSGVREVAKANSTGDRERIARSILSLRRMAWVAGLIQTLILIVLAVPISFYTFKSSEHVVALMLLAVTVLMTSLTAGQTALVQGMRRIGDLARIKVIGTIVGSFISIPLYYLYGLKGIVPALIALAAFNLVMAWWFARKVPVLRVSMTWRESFGQASGLIKLAFAMMWSGLVTSFVYYLTRAFISRQIDIDAVGIFQSASALSGIFISFVLNAMGADFYPRLAAASSDNLEMNFLVNEQTEIGLLLAVPGLIATIVVAPWVIRIFYTAEFAQAANLMRWFVCGCLGRVLSWPMGYILLAKSESRLFVVTETVLGVVHAVLIWAGLKLFGLTGIAVALVLLYILYTGFMLLLSRYLIGFYWNKGVCKLLMVVLPISIGTFVCSLFLPVLPLTVVGGAVCIGVSVYCLRQLVERLGSDHKICRIVRQMPFGKQILNV